MILNNISQEPYKRNLIAVLVTYPGGAREDKAAGVDVVVLVYPSSLVYPGKYI